MYRSAKTNTKKSQVLSPSDRNYLVTAIIDAELSEGNEAVLDKTIPGSRFIKLAKDLVQCFPTECMETYARVTDDGRFISGKGKLYLHWTEVRRTAAKEGLIKIVKKPRGKKRKRIVIEDSDDDENDSQFVIDEHVLDEQVQQSLKILETEHLLYADCRVHWIKTFEARRQQLVHSKASITPHNYALKYRVLNTVDGFKLLEEDFRTLFPGKEQNLYKKWAKLEQFIISRTNKKEKASLNTWDASQRTIFALCHMSTLFSPITLVKKKSQVFRPSRAEVQEAFVTHSKVLADLDTKVHARSNKLKPFDRDVQPFVAIIGLTLKNIRQTFVYLYETLRYEVDDILTAVDIVFKSMHALHTPYPTEAHHIWQFLQRAVYDIPFDAVHNQTITAVETLLNEFQLFKAE